MLASTCAYEGGSEADVWNASHVGAGGKSAHVDRNPSTQEHDDIADG